MRHAKGKVPSSAKTKRRIEMKKSALDMRAIVAVASVRASANDYFFSKSPCQVGNEHERLRIVFGGVPHAASANYGRE